MQLSAFNLYVPDYPQSGDLLIYNTFSGAFAVLDRDEAAQLERAAGSRSPDESSRVLETLCRAVDLDHPDMGMVVGSREIEARAYAAWFADRRQRRDVLHAIVGINLACNFACPYCCQADVLSGRVMKPEVVRATAAWLAARARQIGAAAAHVSFVGGEPLLSLDRLVDLTTALREALDEIPLSLGLITNGYFLSTDAVEQLAALGLTEVKVTLDGDETTHQHTRVSKRGEDTFQRIFDNVIAASRRVAVTVNGNYQADTVSGFGPLVRKLAAAGLPSGSRITFTPALEILDAPEGSGSGSCTWSGAAHAYRVALYDEIVGHGYETPPLGVVGPCAFHDHHMYAIDPDGCIFKCPGFLGHAEWAIGHVTTGLGEFYDRMVAIDAQSACGDCAHRPGCAGGCVAHAYIERGVPEGVNCEIDYFQAVQRDAVIREYARAAADTPREALDAFPPPPVALPAARAAGDPRMRTRAPELRSGVRPPALRVV